MKCPRCDGGMFDFQPLLIPVEGWEILKGSSCMKDGTLRYEFQRGKVRLTVDPHAKPNGLTYKDWLDNQYASIMGIHS